jgi:hypothetical protein
MKRLKSTPWTQLHHYIPKLISQQWNNKILHRKYLSVWGPRYAGIEEDLKSDDLLTVIARQWARGVSKAEKDLSSFDDEQLLRFRYEDFVQSPVAHLERICRHCGLEMTQDMARMVQETVKSDRNLKWQRFDPDVLASIMPELAGEMELNGYEVPQTIVRAMK